MNNYWHTNYKADQEGKVVFRYAVVPHRGFDPVTATRDGIDVSQPLLAIPASGRWIPATSLFVLQGLSSILQLCKPSDDGKGWIVHLFNPASRADVVGIAAAGQSSVRWYRTNLQEQRVEELRLPVTLPGGGVLFLRGEKTTEPSPR
jgi:alpha-mannosidase